MGHINGRPQRWGAPQPKACNKEAFGGGAPRNLETFCNVKWVRLPQPQRFQVF